MSTFRDKAITKEVEIDPSILHKSVERMGNSRARLLLQGPPSETSRFEQDCSPVYPRPLQVPRSISSQPPDRKFFLIIPI